MAFPGLPHSGQQHHLCCWQLWKDEGAEREAGHLKAARLAHFSSYFFKEKEKNSSCQDLQAILPQKKKQNNLLVERKKNLSSPGPISEEGAPCLPKQEDAFCAVVVPVLLPRSLLPGPPP